jgi:hypothetical protein
MDPKLTEELQTALREVLEGLRAAISGATDFVLEQAPLIVQELIRWKRAQHSIELGIWLGLVGLGVYLTLRCLKICRTKEALLAIEAAGLGGAMALGTTIFCFYKMALAIPAFLEVWLAPRIYLLEFIASIVGK